MRAGLVVRGFLFTRFSSCCYGRRAFVVAIVAAVSAPPSPLQLLFSKARVVGCRCLKDAGLEEAAAAAAVKGETAA